MLGTSRDRHLATQNAGAPPQKVVVTHSWLPYTLLSIAALLGGLGWFANMIATVGYAASNSVNNNVNGVNGNNSYISAMLDMFMGFINLYLFRSIALFVSLGLTYRAERHYLSRGAAWTSWLGNLLLLFSWLATDLPFVYSAFSGYGGQAANNNNANGQNNGAPNDSFRTHFCSVNSNYWCGLNTAHGVFSVYCDAVIGLAFLWSCYQLKRARGISNLLLTWPEVAMINLEVFGMLGYLIWTASSIPLGYTRQFGAFGFLDGTNSLNTWRMSWPSLIWGNYLIHAAFIASICASAYISFGGTTAPRMTAIIANWLSFFTLLPAAIYLDRNQNDMGLCNGDYTDANGYRCPSLDGVAAGMTICAAINFLQGLTMFFVLMQAETADFAVDMYGDKARAIDDARSTGTLPLKNVPTVPPTVGASTPYDVTQPSTPEQAYRSTAPLTSIGTGVPVDSSNYQHPTY